MANPQTFTLKQLRFTFTLANNAVFNGANNTLVVSGLRALVNIKGSGMPAFPESDMTIYGMLEQDMNVLTALAFQPLAMNRNTVMVEANSGDGRGWSTVFLGQIVTAGPDYKESPAASLKITARVLGYESLNPANPSSYTGAADVATIVQDLATRMNYGTIENNGVQVQLSNPYFRGTLAEQLRAVKEQSGIGMYVDSGVIAIWPAGGVRATQCFVLSPSSGLVGYPVLDYQRGCVNVRAVFNPAFRFGGPVTVQNSLVPKANGDWAIGTLTHSLQSLALDAQAPWFSALLLYPPSLGIPALD